MNTCDICNLTGPEEYVKRRGPTWPEMQYVCAVCVGQRPPLVGRKSDLTPIRKWIKVVEKERDEAERRIRDDYEPAEFLLSEGYRRCDSPACNCGSWHPDQSRWYLALKRWADAFGTNDVDAAHTALDEARDKQQEADRTRTLAIRIVNLVKFGSILAVEDNPPDMPMGQIIVEIGRYDCDEVAALRKWAEAAEKVSVETRRALADAEKRGRHNAAEVDDCQGELTATRDRIAELENERTIVMDLLRAVRQNYADTESTLDMQRGGGGEHSPYVADLLRCIDAMLGDGPRPEPVR